MKIKDSCRMGFTLVEILVAIAVMALLFLGLYRISRDMLFSERMISYKSMVDRELSRLFDGMSTRKTYEETDSMVQDFNVLEISLKKDVMSASYPTYIDRETIMVPWDGNTATPGTLWALTDDVPSDMSKALRYCGAFDGGGADSMTGSGIVCFSSGEVTEDEVDGIASITECGGNMNIMQMEINSPEDVTMGRSAQTWTVRLRLRDEWIDYAAGKAVRRLERVLTYEKLGSEPEIPEMPVLSNIIFVKFRHRKKYTTAEIDRMNATRGGGSSNPGTDPLAGEGYFPYWANPSELEIEICVGPDPKMAVMIRDHNLRIRASRKLEPVSVYVLPTTSI